MEVRMDIRVLIISFVYTSLISSLPINHIRHINIYGYLSKYGYILETNQELKSKDERIKEGLIKFQKYHDIPTTGVLDAETLKFVKTPRCGVADNVPVIVEDKTPSSNRIKPAEYKVFADRWRSKKLKWYVTRYTNQVTIDKQRSSFRKALSIWEEVSQLEFVEQRDNVDIEIQFVRLDHGDDSPFDGPSRGRTGVVLAHAFPPGGSAISGDAHFDNDEKWTADIDSEDKDKKYLELIAAHEFGHSLGLDHSRVPTALMSAYYVNSQRHYELHEDDIEAIQSLYGAPSGWKPRTTPKPTPPPPVPVCNNLFTAVVWGPDKRTYGVYNDKVIELADKRGVMAIPRSLQDVFPGSPIGVDFAITLPDGSSTFMFRGNSVWKFNGYVLDENYPTMFNALDLPEPPIGIFSVVDNNSNIIYMFGMTRFWRWDPERMYADRTIKSYTSKGYWSLDLPSFGLVTTWNDGAVYFIKSDSYTVMMGKTVADGYPKKGVPVWVQNGCRSSSSRLTVHISHLLMIVISLITYRLT